MDKRIDHSSFIRPGGRSRWPLPRLWAIALVAFRQGMRMRLWVLVLPAIAVLVLADLSAPRFDPVFDAVPAAVSMSLLVMAVLAVVMGVFFATYSLPAELESKVAYSVVTKPVGRSEIVAGKTLGMSLLLLAMLIAVGVGGYVYIMVRASAIHDLAGVRLAEAKPRAAFPADLNALEAIAARGPMQTYRYYNISAGPELWVDLGPEPPGPPGSRWILGQTGMRLTWSLAETPLREWVAAGPGRLRLRLILRIPAFDALSVDRSSEPSAVSGAGDGKEGEQAASAKAQVLVSLLPAGMSPRPEISGQGESGPPAPIYEGLFDLPESGVLEVPLAAPDARPEKGVINVAPSGDLALDVLAMKPGLLVGARAGALRIFGSAGQEFLVAAAPEVRPAQQGHRAVLIGRSRTPREAATFRFDDIPEGRLGAGDTAVEIGFSLDAWAPPSVSAVGQVTFIRPDGQRKGLLFSPEGHHSTVVYLDRNFWHGGPLTVQLESLTDDDYFGLVPESVRLRLDGGPFAWNFGKAILRVWFFGTVLAAAGVFVSTRLTWYVSILAMFAFLVVSLTHGFIVKSTPLGAAARWLAHAADAAVPWDGWLNVTQHLLVPLPDLAGFLPDESVSIGQMMPLAELAQAFGWAALSVVVLVFLGTLVLRRREVAA